MFRQGWLVVALGLGRRSPFVGPASLTGAAPNVFCDFRFGELILIDEIDPAAGEARKMSREQVAALLRPSDIVPDLVLERQAFGQPPLMPGSAIYDVDAEAVVQNIALCLKVGGLDDLHHPSEIVRPEADTEQGAAIDRGSAFPRLI